MLRTKWIVNALRAIWIVFLFNNEFAVFLSSAKRCLNNKSLISPSQDQFMLVGDPQMTDDKSYNRHPVIMAITKFYSALYMKRNYHHLLSVIKPNEVFIMGDLMDNGREWDDTMYQKEVDRFNNIFNSIQPKHYMVGNHDIGFGNGARRELRDRFESYFGNTSYILQSQNYTFIVLDTISLSSDDPKLRNSVLSFLNSDLIQTTTPRILMTHVPLYRSADVSCGPNRQKENTIIPYEAGYQYQNLISKELSEFVLNKVQPIAVFSGDDHDYCKVTHQYNNNGSFVTEITVPTFSMAQGLRVPGVMLLDLSNSSAITTELCWLPDQITIFIEYGYLIAFTFIMLTIYHSWQYTSTKKKMGYSHLSKEEMGINSPQPQHSIMSAKRCVTSFLNSIKDVAIVGITTYIICIILL